MIIGVDDHFATASAWRHGRESILQYGKIKVRGGNLG
jgi:hypothetical protein